MKSPVSPLSASHPSTLVPTTPLSASHLTRSAITKWTVPTARMKDPSAVCGFSRCMLRLFLFCAPARCWKWSWVDNQNIRPLTTSSPHCWHGYAAIIAATRLGKLSTRSTGSGTDLLFQFFPKVFDEVEIRALCKLLTLFPTKPNNITSCGLAASICSSNLGLDDSKVAHRECPGVLAFHKLLPQTRIVYGYQTLREHNTFLYTSSLCQTVTPLAEYIMLLSELLTSVERSRLTSMILRSFRS